MVAYEEENNTTIKQILKQLKQQKQLKQIDQIEQIELEQLNQLNKQNQEINENGLNKTHTKQDIKIAIIIGPEGGITKEEIQYLVENGAKSVSLGKRILRTETAPIVMSAIIMYELEGE